MKTKILAVLFLTTSFLVLLAGCETRIYNYPEHHNFNKSTPTIVFTSPTVTVTKTVTPTPSETQTTKNIQWLNIPFWFAGVLGLVGGFILWGLCYCVKKNTPRFKKPDAFKETKPVPPSKLTNWMKSHPIVVFIFIFTIIVDYLMIFTTLSKSTNLLGILLLNIGFSLLFFIALLNRRGQTQLQNASTMMNERPISFATKWGKNIGVLLMYTGAFFLLITFIVSISGSTDVVTPLSIALAFFATGVGFIALQISQESDNKMAAMAETQYNDKMVDLLVSKDVITAMFFKTTGKSDLEEILYNTKSIIWLKPWLSKDEFTRFKKLVEQILSNADNVKLNLSSIVGSQAVDKEWNNSPYPGFLQELNEIYKTM